VDDRDDDTSLGSDYRYTITFAAPAGVKLRVHWTMTAAHPGASGAIRLAAATLGP